MSVAEIEWTHKASRDLARVLQFLQQRNPAAAKRAAEAILEATQLLRTFPESGRPARRAPDRYREILVRFGRSGYSLLYRFVEGRVLIVAMKHMREAGLDPDPQP